MRWVEQGHWWLQLGSSGALPVGYWPSFLFSRLGASADTTQFGGEVVNTRLSGLYTPTQMGSVRFPSEGYGRAAYFRNSLIPIAGLRLVDDHPSCYDVDGGQGGDRGKSAAEKLGAGNYYPRIEKYRVRSHAVRCTFSKRKLT
ncbi:hypothetical protein GUJ93_ZPchr0008g13749 [Zizania palustris]|uniref:Neprosin PEP catalytic domain-containing protein n=1 Tax=Zizania palustris TaxID=103762 RepID=A0A8J5RK39_ZIZPA|nr:hypothetical protein GUJ93_ZPchr0008g13749 [Zizania palustris]